MRNSLENKTISGRTGSRTLLALTLSASLAAFGCTTNQNIGNGEPATGSPAGRTAPTAGTTGGSSSGGSVPQPMTSSSRLSADDAAAIMAQHQPVRGVVLGVSAQPDTGQARAVTNGASEAFDGTIRQVTVNSTIGNPAGTPALVSGAGDDAIFADADAIVASGGGNAGSTGNAGTTTGAAAVVSSAPVTTSSAALPVSPGAFAAGASTAGTIAVGGTTQGSSVNLTNGSGTLTPTVSSGAVTPVTAATSPVTASGTTTTSNNGSAVVTSGAGTTSSTSATSTTAGVRLGRTNTTSRATGSGGSLASPLRVVRNANGTITVTNVQQQK